MKSEVEALLWMVSQGDPRVTGEKARELAKKVLAEHKADEERGFRDAMAGASPRDTSDSYVKAYSVGRRLASSS